MIPLATATVSGHQQVHIMVLHSSKGSFSRFAADVSTLLPVWEQYVNKKDKLNITLETWDCFSDLNLITHVMKTRLDDHSKPNISVIIAEGDNGSLSMSARIAAQYGIPIILTAFQPDFLSFNSTLPEDQDTAFYMFGPPFHAFRQLTISYIKAGVRSVVAVANAKHGSYDMNSCFHSADILESKGVEQLGKFIIGSNDSRSRVIDIVKEIKALNPDAVLWCDWSACVKAEDKKEFFPLQVFKDLNYLPKAMTMPDCLSLPSNHSLEEQSTYFKPIILFSFLMLLSTTIIYYLSIPPLAVICYYF
jgi:hypothetical protein